MFINEHGEKLHVVLPSIATGMIGVICKRCYSLWAIKMIPEKVEEKAKVFEKTGYVCEHCQFGNKNKGESNEVYKKRTGSSESVSSGGEREYF